MKSIFKNAVEFPEIKAKLIQGFIPNHIHGHYFRNSSGQLNYGNNTLDHWFSGDGAILKAKIVNGECLVKSHFVQTSLRRAKEESQQIKLTRANKWLKHFNDKDIRNTSNTSVHLLKGSPNLMALCQAGKPFIMKKQTLEDIGFEGFGWMESAFSAHPKVDPDTGDIYNIGLKVPNMEIMRADQNMNKICSSSLKLRQVQSIHDFCLAGQYLVIFEYPIQFSLMKMLWHDLYFEGASFTDKLPTICHIYHKHNLSHVKSFDLPPFYCFHFTNGFCEDNQIIMQFFKYDPVSSKSLFEMIKQIPKYSQGMEKSFKGHSTLSEISIDLSNYSYNMEDVEVNGQFPVCSDSVVGKKFRYSYMVCSSKNDELLKSDTICKFDRQSKQTVIFRDEELYFNEPCLIETEQGNYLLVVVNRYNEEKAYIYLFDAENLSKVCVLELPGFLPPGFHGKWEFL